MHCRPLYVAAGRAGEQTQAAQPGAARTWNVVDKREALPLEVQLGSSSLPT